MRMCSLLIIKWCVPNKGKVLSGLSRILEKFAIIRRVCISLKMGILHDIIEFVVTGLAVHGVRVFVRWVRNREDRGELEEVVRGGFEWAWIRLFQRRPTPLAIQNGAGQQLT